ncbi:bifunctional transaldolase/phosoglucose isomerase [bacterium]|nr:bifunctional transaldolase/phosoglucose isomerase [bacterium]
MSTQTQVNPLVGIQEHGQSPWYDNIRRGLIASGELQQMIDQDGLLGITSNPSIFKNAIAGSTDYDTEITALVKKETGVDQIYETLAVKDIQMATDLMRPVYDKTGGRDGYVSLEVSPYLANDTEGTLKEARRLRKAVSRDNVMIKVPATPAGIPAFEQLISEGFNINVTLLFAVEMYEKVALAYLSGLEKRLAAGQDIRGIGSVASFFVSRIDSEIDKRIALQLPLLKSDADRKKLSALCGKTAVANAKMAYKLYKQIIAGPRWKKLAAAGAKVQRLLWASTSTKNPKYRDVFYVEDLIGQDTVNTIPAATFNAFRDHGKVSASLEKEMAAAERDLKTLAEHGIDLSNATAQLLDEGVKAFSDSFDELMSAIEKKREAIMGDTINRQTFNIGKEADAVKAALDSMRKSGFVRRLWEKDPTLWTKKKEHHPVIRGALGWLNVVDQEFERASRLTDFAVEVKKRGFKHALLLGMGGSSLCPEVMRLTFGVIKGFPELHVLDSTVPSQIAAFEKKVDLAKTLCIVSSKSGSTIEPNVFYQYFFDKMRAVKGAKAAENFIAITDPGSALEKEAQKMGFWHIFSGVPEIGGRYSALSKFGLVPAAAMGVDTRAFLTEAERMVHSCASCVPPEDNPGVVLGTILGELAKKGRDKVTIIASPAIGDLGAWLEQLIAESTGKEGTGLIPVADEPLASPDKYGNDRVFAYVRVTKSADAKQDKLVDALEKAGHPVVRCVIDAITDLGEEFFRWEIATATAGAILGINAFDQPNVQESKDNTKALLDEYKKKGSLPADKPILEAEGIALYADKKNAAALKDKTARSQFPKGSLESVLQAHFSRLKAGDYAAFNAYIEMSAANVKAVQAIRSTVRDTKKVATTVGFGPRFLHSTGQLHKGGPDSGFFTQITCDDASDLSIPGEKFTFGILKEAQALGDFQCLAKRGRRLLRVHLGKNVEKGLERLRKAVAAVTR